MCARVALTGYFGSNAHNYGHIPKYHMVKMEGGKKVVVQPEVVMWTTIPETGSGEGCFWHVGTGDEAGQCDQYDCSERACPYDIFESPASLNGPKPPSSGYYPAERWQHVDVRNGNPAWYPTPPPFAIKESAGLAEETPKVV
jgi:hypothetical protein